MKNNRFSHNCNIEEAIDPIGLGVIFIKTRKSEDKVRKMTDEITELAAATEVEIVDVVIDDSYGSDIDRSAISELSFWIENSPVGVIFVKSLLDITQDKDDLEKFLDRAEYFGMIIVDVDASAVIMPGVCEETLSKGTVR